MPNPLCHFEFMTADVARCRAFYSGVFDWRFDDGTMPGYTLIQTGQDAAGGMFQKPPNAPFVCLNVYFSVSDIDATLQKAISLGGRVVVPRTPIPGVGHFAMFADPENVVIGIMQSLT